VRHVSAAFKAGLTHRTPKMQGGSPVKPSFVAACVLLICVCPLVSFAAAPALSKAEADFDDCDARFVAAIGSNAYQFSPLLKGDLGTVRLYSILSYQKTAA